MTFPKHDHVWEVLLIENLPVGVACKICDHTVQMTEVAEVAPVPVLDLDARKIFKIKLSGGGPILDAYVSHVSSNLDNTGRMRIDLGLELLQQPRPLTTMTTATLTPMRYPVWK